MGGFGNKIRRAAIAIAGILVALFALIWPAIYNGQPFIFQDTVAYIRAIDAGAQTLGVKSRWSAPAVAPSSATQSSTLNAPTKIVLSGRSIYYGLLLYLGDLADGGWLSVTLQALAAMLAIALTLRDCGSFRWRNLAAICVAMAVFTPLAFFASFLMPDVFAGIAILAVANVMALGETMSNRRLVAWLALLSASLLFHTSIVMIAVIMAIVVGLYWLAIRQRISARTVLAISFALCVGFIGEASFGWMVRASAGSEPIRPPFLTARLLADGPGANYLKANCPLARFAVCKFTGLLPVKTSDAFLWSIKPHQGGFMLADAATKRSLSDEQYRFALAVAAYDPLGTLGTVTRDTLVQLGSVQLSEFNRNRFDWEQWRFFKAELPTSMWADQKQTKYWRGEMPVTIFSYLDLLAALASLGYLAAQLITRFRSGKPSPSRADQLAILLLLGFLTNAFVCGAFSGPHMRYQARVLWLLPFVALLVYRDSRTDCTSAATSH